MLFLVIAAENDNIQWKIQGLLELRKNSSWVNIFSCPSGHAGQNRINN